MAEHNFKVDLSKELPGTADHVYDAWTNPEKLKQWWKPMNNELVEVINDLKEGGTVRYVFQDNGLIISGKYLQVEEKKKLVYTWNWEVPKDEIKNSAYQLTVEFLNEGAGSTIHVIQDNFENEEGTIPHKQGWEKGLNDLEQYLNGNSN